MKLVICASEFPPINSSGIGNVANEVVRKLRLKGVECIICSPTGPDIKLGSSLIIQKFGIIGLLFYWYKVSKYFNENDCDIAWLHNPLFLKNNPFKRSLITIHTTYHGYFAQRLNPKIYYKIAMNIERYCLSKLCGQERFTAVSPSVCKELEEIGINKEKIVYIPNGVDIEVFKPLTSKILARKEFGLLEDNKIILSIGRLTEMKQPSKLIEVFSIIEKEMKNINLVIAGKGELLNEIKKFTVQKKLRKVNFLGFVDQEKKPNLYACSDIYIMTSKYEGQPLTLLEAISSGLPCIVSNIPNLRIVKDAKCGLVVDFSDVEKASQEIIEYLKQDNSKHAKNARQYAEENLDWDIITEKYLKEFKFYRKENYVSFSST